MMKRFLSAYRRFMYGRYGQADQLNLTLLISSVVLSFANNLLAIIFKRSAVYSMVVYPLFWLIMISLLGFCVFRMLSHNIYKRQTENKWFQRQIMRLKDRKNRYFRCPSCGQTVRVPRGRGKVNIRCPKCGEKFIKKT